MKKFRKNQGFTLLEMVISITLLALMALMITRIFSESTRAIKRGKDQIILDESARLILGNIEQDLSQAVIRTNIAFRISSVAGLDALYFISPGARRNQENISRDTAPMRIRLKRRLKTGLPSIMNHRIVMEFTAANSTDDTSKGNANLIYQSDVYYPSSSSEVKRNDFHPVKNTAIKPNHEASYYLTDCIENIDGLEQHASVTFMEFLINGNSESNREQNRPPNQEDLPRFVDVSFGLVSAHEMRQAMRYFHRRSETAANEFLQKREQIYTRRIALKNRGTAGLDFTHE